MRGRLRWTRTPRSTWVTVSTPKRSATSTSNAELHAVPRCQPRLVEHGPWCGRFPREGLAHVREMREQEVDHRARHELGHAAPRTFLTVQGSVVEPLHQRHVRLPRGEVREQEWTQKTGDVVRREVLDVGIEEHEELRIGLVERHGHGLALSAPDGPGFDHACLRPAGDRRGVVCRSVVDDHDVVDEVHARRPTRSAWRARSTRWPPPCPRFVARRQAHRHPSAGARHHQGGGVEVPMVEAAQGGGACPMTLRTHASDHPPSRAGVRFVPPPLTWVVGFVHHGGIIQSG